MNAVCPACGVAVVPGYVKCPRCHAPLPYGGGRRGEPGGTALKDRSFPIAAIVIAVAVAIGVVAVFGLRGRKRPAAATITQAQPRQVPQPGALATAPTAPARDTPSEPTGPLPAAVASDLDRALKRKRLWGTVEVVGRRVDVRSGSCRDPAMGPLLDSARDSLHGAGLIKLRCLEQSGLLVFERDL